MLALVMILAACAPAATPDATPAIPSGASAAASTAITLSPAALLNEARMGWQQGLETQAATNAAALLTAYPDAPEAPEARLMLARHYAALRRWASVANVVQPLAETATPRPQALFWRGRAQEEAGQWADALASYTPVASATTPLQPYALLRMAALHQQLGDQDAAARAYEQAASFDMTAGERAGALEKAIAIRRAQSQSTAALALYDQILGFARSPAYRARILAETAALADELGDTERAAALRQELVEQHPQRSEALAALDALIAATRPVSPTIAAQVYTTAERYDDALPQFDRAIAGTTGEPAAELRRQRALVVRAQGDFAAAQAELAAIAAEWAGSVTGTQARLDAIQTQGQAGDTGGAIAGYQQFAADLPDSPLAAEALNRAAILLGRLGDTEGALAQQLALGQTFPATPQGREALDAVGWARFNAGDLAAAREAWDTLAANNAGAVAARASFWAARTLPASSPEWTSRLQATLAAAPVSYYAERAGELLQRPPAEGVLPLGAPIPAAQWRAAEGWIAGWSGAEIAAIDDTLPEALATTGSIQRAATLAEVGLQREAIGEWNDLRDRWAGDPARLYALARAAHHYQTPYIALKATEDLLALAPATAGEAPVGLQHLLFPTPYAGAVVAEAQQRGLDPRALYALMRQESLFNPGATSWAGARGLAQVMPGTAAGIAIGLEMPEYNDADLYRPAVSIRFGAHYIAAQLRTMDGSLPGALAAYNGGPGNAQRWAGGTTVADPDLFVESIDYPETQGYVRLVYGFYGAYQRLYQVQ